MRKKSVFILLALFGHALTNETLPCDDQWPEAVGKCRKALDNSLKYISTQKSSNEKQLMFCCALNDFKTCLKALNCFHAEDVHNETTRCDATHDADCAADDTHWLLSSVVVVVVVAVVAFLWFVIRRDRKRILKALGRNRAPRETDQRPNKSRIGIHKSKSFFL